MRAIYLGSLSSFHAQNTLQMFTRSGYEVLALNTSRQCRAGEFIEIPRDVPSYDAYPIWRDQSKIGRWRDWLSREIGLWNKESVSRGALYAIERHEPDLVYAAWGPQLSDEIRAIKGAFPELPVVHSVQCFPTIAPSAGLLSLCGYHQLSRERLSWQWQRLKALLYLSAQLRDYGQIVGDLDGRIDCSRSMKAYIEGRYQVRECPTFVWMERYCRQYFHRHRLPLLSQEDGEPHLVFLGRTDFGHSRVDDIRHQIQQIASEGIHIHLSESSSPVPPSDYIHQFPRWNSGGLSDGALATFCTQFDGCIVLYNVGDRSARFHNTLPSRFLFAFPAGIPAILPAGTFSGCEQVVDEYGVGFTYDSIENLRETLHDSGFMNNLRERCVQVMGEQTFENKFDLLDGFLREVIG